MFFTLVKKGSLLHLEFQASVWPQVWTQDCQCYRQNIYTKSKAIKKKKFKKGFSLLSLTGRRQKGPAPFLLCRPEIEDLSWNSFCLYLVCSYQFLAAFQTTPRDNEKKRTEQKKSQLFQWYFELWFPSSIHLLTFNFQSPHCSMHSVQGFQ